MTSTNSSGGADLPATRLLAGRVAVVTGGASGIGRAIVLRFAAEGARVVAVDLNADNGKSLLADAEAAGLGDSVCFEQADVSSEDDVARAVGRAGTEFGRLDVMVNNAGVGGAFGPITEVESDDWDYTFAVLVRGVFLGTKYAVRAMAEHGDGGSIINTASIAGLSGGAGPAAYSAAKAAVINLSRSNAVELASSRIRVNAICPGIIMTPLLHQGREEQTRALLPEIQPWPDYGRPENIAGAALFLAGDDSTFVTGQAIAVDGGMTAIGPDLANRLRTAPGDAGLVGVNRGTTGERSQIRRRLGRDTASS
ncbi:MAG TPA: SDR family oxidoreductase [Pseudonocardia sp.]|jgi:NAD(P)-dependent dehydrogenase (short-subunit alcohol dehydrogenase family)